ncbi:MAG: pilus assembly protein TadG-related protein [Siculibacillus sp.]|nr:pilus assembly protein TadG-related protein [Siculibacillus sp.]
MGLLRTFLCRRALELRDRLVLCGSDRSGNIGMIAALGAIPLVLATGIAVDYARASAAKADLQAAVDAAVLAGARDASAGWSSVATGMLSASVRTKDFTVASSTFTQDASGNYVGTATGTVKATFSGLVSVETIPIAATATAVTKAASDKVCILLLNTSATPGLLLNGGANINASNCQVHVKSTGNPAATFNASTTLSTKKICVAGSSVLDNGGTHPNLSKGCTTVTDPFAGTLPTPSSSTCTYTNVNVNGGTFTASPGVYCGWTNLNSAPTINFQPGVYVIKGGGVNVNGGTWNGTGVTFYFPDTSYIQFNGTTKLNLSAPTSGTYANLLMYEATGLAKTSFTMNATNGANLSGLIHLPSRQLTLNSGANVSSNNLTMVLDTLTVNTVNWTLDSSDKIIAASGSSGSTAGVYLKQ